jgi:hypothetical protein
MILEVLQRELEEAGTQLESAQLMLAHGSLERRTEVIIILCQARRRVIEIIEQLCDLSQNTSLLNLLTVCQEEDEEHLLYLILIHDVRQDTQ